MRSVFYVFILFFMTNCRTETRENSRIYIEGRITETSLELPKVKVKIKSNNSVVAEAIPAGAGDFTLSGPLFSGPLSLVFNAKIKSFESSKAGVIIAADSMQILIPEATTYITFNNIKIK